MLFRDMELQNAARELEFEINEEATRLIREEGLGSWDAIEKAKDIVQARRRRKTAARSM